MPDLFKLERLKVLAFSDQQRSARVGTFEAMFNPESITQGHRVRYGSGRYGLGSTDDDAAYVRTEASDLTLDLLLDGTGVSERIGLPPGPAAQSVSQRIDAFMGLAFRYEGRIHRPNYLQLCWGALWGGQGFDCRLISVDVNYTRFGRDGSPLRAILSLVLRSDATWEAQLRRNRPSSPDLTHGRLVQAGDTLPLLAESVYGSPRHAPFLARANGLDDLRFLTPGTRLVFPPLPGQGGDGAG